MHLHIKIELAVFTQGVPASDPSSCTAHFRGWGTVFSGCSFNSSSTRPRRDEKDEFVLSETGSSVSSLVGEARSHVLAGPSRHLFPEFCLGGAFMA